MVTKIIYLNLKDMNIVPEIHIPKSDSGLRAFEFHLLDGDEIYQIPTNVTITIRGTKPDKNGFAYGCTYESATGIVRCDCTAQMTAVVGMTLCELILVDTSTNKVSTFVFYLFIEPNAVDENTNYSESDFDYVNTTLDRIQSSNFLVFVEYTMDTLNFATIGYEP